MQIASGFSPRNCRGDTNERRTAMGAFVSFNAQVSSLTTHSKIPTFCLITSLSPLPKGKILFCLLGPPRGNEVAIIAWLIAIFTAVWILAIISKWLTRKIWKGKARMQETLSEYESVISRALPKLLAISELQGSARATPDKWSKKEILGHLIDSASNNHQRFVRAQLSGEIKLPNYDQVVWVRTQEYQTETWEDLVHLWKLYNLHLLHIVESIPVDKLNSMCFIGESEPVTLEFLIQDYVRHLKHHLEQIFA